VFSHFLAPYVENLDMGLVNLGIVQGELMPPLECKRCNILRGLGQVTLGKLRIKKGALDMFRLPVDVSESVYRHYPRGALVNIEE
jgi:vacuolar protein sorting-associated protein 13A/C